MLGQVTLSNDTALDAAPLQSDAGRAGRLALIAALYSAQNLSLGFFTYAFLTIAQARGVPLTLIGASAGIALILTLKFLWAPLVDRFGVERLGHYRGWLLITQTVLSIGIAALAFFDPAQDFTTILVLFAVLFVFAGTQDIAADAAATRLLKSSERGIGNGFQSAGSSVSQVIGGGVVLIIYQFAGWQIAALSLAVFSLIPLPFVLGWRESETTADQPAPRATLRSALGFFSQPGIRWWCFALLPAYTFGFTVAYNLVRPILVADGWDEGRIGLVVVLGGSVVGILAGISAGWLVSKIGRQRAILWLGALQVIATIGVLPIALGSTPTGLVLAVVALSNAAFSAAFAVVYTICMDLTRHESAGTDFTYLTTVTTIMMVIAGGLGVALAGIIGFVPVITIATGIGILGLWLTVRNINRVLPTP